MSAIRAAHLNARPGQTCIRGHDTSEAGSRYASGRCRECAKEDWIARRDRSRSSIGTMQPARRRETLAGKMAGVVAAIDDRILAIGDCLDIASHAEARVLRAEVAQLVERKDRLSRGME